MSLLLSGFTGTFMPRGCGISKRALLVTFPIEHKHPGKAAFASVRSYMPKRWRLFIMFIYKRRVKYYENEDMQVVNHANYLHYIEKARVE